MSSPIDSGSRDSRRRARALLATLVGGVFAVIGAVAVVMFLAGQEPAPPQPNGARSPAGDRQAGPTPSDGSAQGADEPSKQVDAGLDYSAPVRVRIPSIDVSSPLVDLGLDSQGVMQTPQNPDRAGWFTPAPPPGVPGASVISGHVTWNQEPVVFFRLGDLRNGDTITVDRADGTTAVFEVYKTGTFPKKSFPTQAVYDQPDQPELRLITCGGGYDEQTNNYKANVIVWATMTSAGPSRA